MKDTEIHEKFGIPISTLQDWKKRDDDNWRKKLYLHLKNDDEKEEQKKIIDEIKSIVNNT